MRDMKEVLKLGGDANWAEVPYVFVGGDDAACPWEKDGEEEIIRSWRAVAVLRVTCPGRPRDAVPSFFIGFRHGNTEKFLKYPLSAANGPGDKEVLLGMRVGDGDVGFTVVSQHLMNTGDFSLELIEVVDVDDPRYADLPLY